jgi:hypothetical protein
LRTEAYCSNGEYSGVLAGRFAFGNGGNAPDLGSLLNSVAVGIARNYHPGYDYH